MENSQSPLLSKLRNDFQQSISQMYKDLKRWFGISFLGFLRLFPGGSPNIG